MTELIKELFEFAVIVLGPIIAIIVITLVIFGIGYGLVWLFTFLPKAPL